GAASARTAGIALQGARNQLIAAGILAGKVEAAPTQWLDMPDGDCFTFSEDAGLIRFCADLGDTVTAGQTIALIYPTGRTGLEPVALTARKTGLFTARHFPGLVKPGDCVAVIAVQIAD
ncbi:MAG: succinylglutamate desuccinylase/aspartoacylase family protein, partial [Gemmobacter sp.]